jgi:signal transduction histidine kinase
MMKASKKFLLLTLALPILAMGAASAEDRGTKPEAMALVKKAVEYVKANGAEKAYAEFSNKTGQFKDRDLYVVVYDTTGKCLAHGSNSKLIGKDLIDAQDADGVFYVKKRVELMKTSATFWQDYKFSDPLTKKIEPKSTYCQKVDNTAVCVGIYK